MKIGLERKCVPALVYNAEIKRIMERDNAVDIVAVYVFLQHCSFNNFEAISYNRIGELLKISTARVSAAVGALVDLNILRTVMEEGNIVGYKLQHIYNEESVARFEIIKEVKVEVQPKEKKIKKQLGEEDIRLGKLFCEYLHKRFNYAVEKFVYPAAYEINKLSKTVPYADIEKQIRFLSENYEKEKFLPVIGSARQFVSCYPKICVVAKKYNSNATKLEV